MQFWVNPIYFSQENDQTWRGCLVGLIISENVENVENIVKMQYQVNPMSQTQENCHVHHSQSFGSSKIKLWQKISH